MTSSHGLYRWFHQNPPIPMALRWLLTVSTVSTVSLALGSDVVTELPGAGKLRTVVPNGGTIESSLIYL